MEKEGLNMASIIDFFKRLFGRCDTPKDVPLPETGKALIVAVNEYPNAPLQGTIEDASNFQ